MDSASSHMPFFPPLSSTEKTTDGKTNTNTRRPVVRRILTDTEASLLKQYTALLATEGVGIVFTDDAIDALARLAAQINANVENIGARRLHTILERVLEEISFHATDRSGETVTIDGAYVERAIGALAQDVDLSRFIL